MESNIMCYRRKRLTIEEIEALEEQGYVFTNLRKLKQGDLFELVPDGELYVRAHYDRSAKKYCCYLYEDVNRDLFLNGGQLVIAY